MSHLFAFGYGYSARRVGTRLLGRPDAGWRVTGTRTSARGVHETRGAGVGAALFDGSTSLDDEAAEVLRTATHVLVSIAPDALGDSVLRLASDVLRASPDLAWVGYLSTTGVYGDHGGAWVDESTPAAPGLPRTERRVEAERAWTRLCEEMGVPLQIFRLSGIYGPGRSVVERIRTGVARHVVKPGHVFNRIHVDDIAGVVAAGIAHPERIGVYNVADDLPSASSEVLLYAAELLGIEAPPPVPYADAGMGPMGRSFWDQSRRVRAERAKRELEWTLRYPTYREGIRAIIEAG